MELLLNEHKYITNILNSAEEFNKPQDMYYNLTLFAKLLDQNDVSKDEKIRHLRLFVSRHSARFKYRCDKWDAKILKIIKATEGQKLYESDGIPVTQKELDAIAQLADYKAERVAFTMLILAKYNSVKYSVNDGWVNFDKGEIFLRANVGADNHERNQFLTRLDKAGLTERPKSYGNVNSRVLFIDEESEPKAMITDLRNLGYQYDGIAGKRTIYHCPVCGLAKVKSGPCSGECSAKAGTENPQRVKVCCDCGKQFTADARANKKIRCDECQKIFRAEYLKYQRKM